MISRWLGGIEQLEFIAERLLRVQIENRPAIDVIKLYDSKETLFYCDPPYIHETRGDTKSYGFEMDDNNHRALAATLNSIEGLAAVSNYECELMEELYPASKWSKLYSSEKTIHSTKDVRQEVLWVNYNLEKLKVRNANSSEKFTISPMNLFYQ